MNIIIDIKKINITESNLNVLKEFCVYCCDKLKYNNDIRIILLPKEHDQDGISTAAYDRINEIIYTRYGDRALVDVCRSIAHELAHGKQNQKGCLDSPNIPNIGGPIEDSANAIAGRLVKMFVQERNFKKLYKM